MKHFQRVFELPPLTAIPQPQRHLFHFLFHPDFPMRVRSTFNDQAVKAWQAGVSRGIQLFKQSNRLSQFEPWYQELIEHFCAVADFVPTGNKMLSGFPARCPVKNASEPSCHNWRTASDSNPAYSYFGLQPHVSLHYGTSPFG